MKRTLFLLLATISIIGAYAEHGWKRVNYRNSTIFSATVWVKDQPAKKGDVVAAFIGDECRMIAPVFINNDTAYVSSVIHGEKKEEIEFRLWQQTDDKVYTDENKVTSQPGESIFLHRISIK